MIKSILLTLGFCLLSGTTSFTMGQRPLLTGKEATVDSHNGRVIVRFGLEVPVHSVGRNYRHTLTPALIPADTTTINKVLLTPLSPVGKRKARSEHRRAVLGGRAKSFNRLITTKSDVKEGTPYQMSIPYEAWMGSQPLSLVAHRAMNNYDKRWNSGSTILIEKLQLASPWQVLTPLMPPPAKPFTLTEQLSSSERWIKPLSHYIHHDRTANLLLPLPGALQLDFRLGSTHLRPGVGNNGATLARLKELIDKVRSDSSAVSIDRIVVVGQALSDGDDLLEAKLIGRRAEAVKRYLENILGVSSQQIQVLSVDSVWASLQSELRYSALAEDEKREVLEIMGTTPDAGIRERRLMMLNNGSAYWYIKDHLLPGMQDAVYIRLYYTEKMEPERAPAEYAIGLMNQGRYAEAVSLLENLSHKTDSLTTRISNLAGICRLVSDSAVAASVHDRIQVDSIRRQFVLALQEIPQQPIPQLLEQDSAFTVMFRVGKSLLDKTLDNNAATLEKIAATLDEVVTHPLVKLGKVRIIGQASPEGGYGLNVRLSAARAKVLREYILQHTSLAKEQFDIVNQGPSWSRLRAMVIADPRVPYKVDVVRIIDSTLPGAERDSLLQNLKGGRAYRYICNHLFPELRNATYITVSFDLLPDTNREIINRAIGLIRRDHYSEAETLLESVKNDGRAALPLRVVRLMNGTKTTMP